MDEKMLKEIDDKIIMQGEDLAYREVAFRMLQKEKYIFREISEITGVSIKEIRKMEADRVMKQSAEKVALRMLKKGSYIPTDIAEDTGLGIDHIWELKKENKL